MLFLEDAAKDKVIFYSYAVSLKNRKIAPVVFGIPGW